MWVVLALPSLSESERVAPLINLIRPLIDSPCRLPSVMSTMT
jgi:hypothetical protein